MSVQLTSYNKISLVWFALQRTGQKQEAPEVFFVFFCTALCDQYLERCYINEVSLT